MEKVGKPYQVGGHWYKPLPLHSSYDETGIASWYGRDFHGKLTANGETYDMHALSAAHKTLPLPTLVRVTNLANGRSVVVRVNDRGPFVKNRLIDLSYAAAKELGYLDRGTTRVRVQTLDLPAPNDRPQTAAQPQPYGAVEAPIQSNTPQSSRGHIHVQIGAFGNPAYAKDMMQKLQPLFPSAHIVTARSAQRTLYKVRIGPFERVNRVEQAVQTLQQHGFGKPMVIIE